MTDLRTHWMRTVHEALCGLSAKRLMLGERIIGGECATADVTCHGCRAVLRLAAMDAASGGPDDLRTLAQAVVDGRDWSRGRLAQALGVVTTCPEDVDALARAILAALNAERDAADARGYARAMGDANALLKAEAQSAVDKARASNDPTKEGYSMAVRDMRAAVRGLATKQAAAAERN